MKAANVNPKNKLGLVALSLAVVAIGAIGCSKSDTDSSEDSANTTVTTAAVAEESDGVDTADEPEATEASGTAVLADGEAPAERTIMMSDTAFSPSTLTIDVGENVTFKAEGDGIYGVIVGDLDGYTVTGGLIETFEFPEAGTYPISEDINGYEGTITVK